MKWLTVDIGQEHIVQFEMFPISHEEKPFDNAAEASSLEEIAGQQEKVFQDILFSMIDERKLKDSEVYQRAWIDRKYFSKIRTKRGYVPKRNTVIALGLALRLDEKEFDYLFASAGYSLVPASRFDRLVRYCFQHKIYRMRRVNEILSEYTGMTL